MRNNRESEITKAILAYLRASGIVSWKNWSGPMTPIRGISDILGVLPPGGRFLAIEVKTATGKLTEHQLRFLSAVREAGGVAFVARSLDDVISTLREVMAHEGQ